MNASFGERRRDGSPSRPASLNNLKADFCFVNKNLKFDFKKVQFNEGAARFPSSFANVAGGLDSSPFKRKSHSMDRGSPKQGTEAAGPARLGRTGEVREIASASNPGVRLVRELRSGRGIRKHGRALVAGSKIAAEVIARCPERVEAWITTTGGDGPPAPLAGRVVWWRLEASLFRELDLFGTRAPLLVVQAPDWPVWSPEAPWPLGCTLFLPFQDPENVGAALRSAAAFGAARAVLLKEAAHPLHPKAVRAAGPSVFELPILQGPSIEALEAGPVPIVPLGLAGPAIDAEPWPARFGLLPGLEGPGLPERWRRDPAIRRIPIAPGVESLNAAAAVAVALYEWGRGTGWDRDEGDRRIEG